MTNPWEQIDLAIYEQHMSSDEVHQLQTLSQITKTQLADNDCTSVGILGVAGGNGLSHIDPARTQKVYAVDINKHYLDICRERYNYLGDTLELRCCDLTKPDVALPFTTLLICNLIVEYIGTDEFVATMARNKNSLGVVSCVIQKNNNASFVGNSKLAAHFDPIATLHQDIDGKTLKSLFAESGFACIKQVAYPLPNGKEFIRTDFSAGK